jgi:WD40 repeat protein
VGSLLASAGLDGSVILWNSVTAQPLRVFRYRAGVSDLEFSVDGSCLAGAGLDGHLHVSNFETVESFVFAVSRSPLVSIAWAPDGTRIAVRAVDGVQIVDAKMGRALASWSTPGIAGGGIGFSKDGRRIVTAGADYSVRVWNASTHSLLDELQGHMAPTVNAIFDPSGTIIASTSNDHTVRLWDAASGRELRTLAGHVGTPFGIGFSPDGSRLASSSTDETIKLWDVASGLELQSLVGHTGWVKDIAFSADGQHLASAGYDSTVRVWHAPSDSTNWTTEREAAALVGFLAPRLTSRHRLTEAIQTDLTINEEVRSAAHKQVKSFLTYWPVLLAGHRAAERREWPAATEAFEQVTNAAPNDVMHWHWLAMASFAGGRKATYERACDELLSRFGKSGSTYEKVWTAKTWLISPRHGEDTTALRELVDSLAVDEARTFPWLYEVQTGKPVRDPKKNVTPPATLGPLVDDWFVLAMAWHRAGDEFQARSAYQAGMQQARSGTINSWPIDCYNEALQRQVEAVLSERPDLKRGSKHGATTGSPSLSDPRHPLDQPVSSPSATSK